MIESRHLGKRVRQRTGINKKASKKFIDKAERDGFTLNDLRSSKKLYTDINNHILDDGIYGIILYNRYFVIYNKKADVGITLLQLPYRYHKYEDRLKESRRKQNESNNDTESTTSFGG